LPFPYSKAIEKGGGSYHLLLLQYKVATFFAMLQGKKRSSKTKQKEGDGNFATIAFFFAVVAFLAVLQRNAAKQDGKEGDRSVTAVTFFVVQCISTRGRRRRQQLLSPSLLHCSAAPQEQEEGDDSCHCNTKEKKKAMVALLSSPSLLHSNAAQLE
jgi:hypothetical protein